MCVCARLCTVGDRLSSSVYVSAIEKHKGIFGSHGVHTSLCMSRHPSNGVTGAVSGTVSGSLIVWKGRQAVSVLPGFEDAVTAIVCVDGVGIVAGSVDCSIRFWLADMTPGDSCGVIRTYVLASFRTFLIYFPAVLNILVSRDDHG